MENLCPNIFVENINETLDFYKLLGFQLVNSVPEEGDFVWVMMTNGAVSFMFQSFDSLGDDLPEIKRTNGAALLFYINVKNIKEYFEQIKEKVKVLKGLETTFYGATEFSILDNNDYVLTFAEHE